MDKGYIERLHDMDCSIYRSITSRFLPVTALRCPTPFSVHRRDVAFTARTFWCVIACEA